MKTRYPHILPILLMTVCLVSCRSAHQADGWYPVSEDDRVVGPAIVTVGDFASLSMDTVSIPEHYVITGQIRPEKVAVWTAATRQRIGERIGFLFEDKVVMAPTINCPVESGAFTIETSDNAMTVRIYEVIREKL